MTYKGISWKFEANLFKIDKYMDVPNNVCSQVW